MNLLDAAYHTVHDYPGGAGSLAPRLGKAPSTLSNEVRPPILGTAKLGFLDAIKIAELTCDMRIPAAVAAHFGKRLVDLPDVCHDGADSAVMRLGFVGKEFGDVCSSVSMALNDGSITPNELKVIDREMGELVSEIMGLRSSIERMLNGYRQAIGSK